MLCIATSAVTALGETIDIRLKITLIDDGDLQVVAVTRQLSFTFHATTTERYAPSSIRAVNLQDGGLSSHNSRRPT